MRVGATTRQRFSYHEAPFALLPKRRTLPKTMRDKAVSEEGSAEPSSSRYMSVLLAISAVNWVVWLSLLTASNKLAMDGAVSVGRLNNTARSNQRTLFFNRAPKTGSTSLVHWIKDLSSR